MMTKGLFAGASLLALGFAVGAHADPLTISTETTTAVKTSAAANGTAGDITIATAGSIKPTSGVAVTIDSNNGVNNQGTIAISGADNSGAIQASAGVTGSITHSGTITINETYTRTDTNGDGVLDGAYAQGSNRFGIRALGGFTGNITSTGGITVQGNNSGGILLDGPLTGALASSGTIVVTGDNGYGIRTGAVSGDVTIGGTIGVAGTGSSAVLIGGDVGGTVKINATMQSTGYSTVSVPSSTSSLTADNLKQGGPGLWIAGNVAGGVQLLSAVTTTNSDNTTTTTPGVSITSYGSAPGLLIGSSTNAITLGAISGDANGFGLALGGAVTGSGLYANVDATAVKLGGLGQAVAVTNGIRVTGTMAALSNGGSATGIQLGSGTSAPTFANLGSIGAGVTGTVATGATPRATALQIDAGANLPSLTNSGAILAKGVTGVATTAIRDLSGTLRSITNTGSIGAGGGTTNIAIDLSSVTSGASITQSAASGTTVPSISGAILFGGGSNSLNVSAGSVSGDVTFAGSGNSFALSGASLYAGTVDFANTAGTLSLAGTASFQGLVKNGGNVALTVSGGTLAPSVGTSTLGSLAMTGGTLGVTIDGTTGTSSVLQVGGNASFGAGTTVALQFTKLGQVAGNFTFLQAGSITGANNLTLGTALPFLFTGSLSANPANTALTVSIARKSATQLGLSGNVAAIYEPALVAAATDDGVGSQFLALSSSAGLVQTLTQLMPIYETGALDSASLATRAANSVFAEHTLPTLQTGSLGAWIQMVGWTDRKAIRTTQGYSTYGAGFVLGVEHTLGGFGRVGLSGVYGWGVNKLLQSDTASNTTQAQIGAYWRGTWGGLHAYATGAYGRMSFDNSRTFNAGSTRTSTGNWNGTLYSAAGGVSWQLDAGNFFARPSASIDYLRLKEKGYTENGGGTGVNLIVNGRTSAETGVNGALAVGYYLRKPQSTGSDFVKVELEGGARHLLDSNVDALTAHFAGGSDFALTPEARKAGWTAKLRLIGGGDSFSMSGEIGAEKQQDHVAGTARVGVHFAL